MAHPSAQVFTIPAGVPFVDALATGILARAEAEGGPLALAQYSILLPTRRACRDAPRSLPPPVGRSAATAAAHEPARRHRRRRAEPVAGGNPRPGRRARPAPRTLHPAPATAAGPRHPGEGRQGHHRRSGRPSGRRAGPPAGSGAYRRRALRRPGQSCPRGIRPALADHAGIPEDPDARSGRPSSTWKAPSTPPSGAIWC